ncbi:MAG: divergent polysaccharide deacetylase family protein [Paracoccaceae bacterium]|nr:divergent polysaccharide deacetylase family protein [Paracoccaceae bacterium]
MARGILNRRRLERLKSTVWGGASGIVVGGAMVAVASQLAVRHDLALPQPEARAVETPAGTEFDQARPETDPAVPTEETVPAADVAAISPAEPAPADASPRFDTAPAAAPQTAFAGPEAPGRPEVPRAAGVALTDREGLRPETAGAPEARAPLPPRTDQPAAVVRDVPAPPVRETAPQVAEAAPERGPAPADAPVAEMPGLAAPEEDASPVVAEAPQDAGAPAAPDALLAEATREPRAEPSAAPAPGPVVASLETQAPRGPAAAPSPDLPRTVTDAVPSAPAPAAPEGLAPAAAPALTREAAEAPTEPETPQTADIALTEVDSAPQPGAESPEMAAPVAPEAEPAIPENPQLADAGGPAGAVEPRRIVPPSDSLRIAQAPEAAPGMPGVPSASIGQRVGALPGSRSDTGTAPEVAQPAPDAGRALDRHRHAFEADPGLARVAVVLVHEGAAPPEAGALADLPGEVSFAVDGASLNAAAIAAAYRAAGREVVLIPSIPAGARPQDVEVALQSNFGAVPEAVAVMDPGTAGFQGDRDAVGQVIAVIAETGHGLITAPQGLNTAQQIAGRFDVPASLIFGDLGAGTDAAAVSRALDRAAFRARLEAGVILVGRADAATVEGLGQWLQGRNAQSLALAPVSAVIAPQTAPDAVEETEDEAAAATTGLPRVRAVPDSRSN